MENELYETYRKIAILGELIELCDKVELEEQKANSYKELKQYNNHVPSLLK